MKDIFKISKNDWSETEAPAGDANQLNGWTNDAEMYSNKDRRYLYEDSSWLHSSRIACDARISFMARKCYEGAFTEDNTNTGNTYTDTTRPIDGGFATDENIVIPEWGGFLGGSTPFCATWGLDDLKEKCADVGCAAEEPTEFNYRGHGRSFAEEALTLLIEDKLYEKDEDWEKVVPAPYKNFIYVEKGCPVNCPTATTWSEWSCFCKKDIPDGKSIDDADVNPLNLPVCNCQKKKRYRVQLCSNAEGGSCEMYSGGENDPNSMNYGPSPLWYNDSKDEKCKMYGNYDIVNKNQQSPPRTLWSYNGNNGVNANNVYPMFGYNDPNNKLADGSYSVSTGVGFPLRTGQNRQQCDHSNTWKDSKGRTCADYASKNLCTDQGVIGQGFIDLYWKVRNQTYENRTVKVDENGTVLTETYWEHETLEDFAVDGNSASICYQCGCGGWFDLYTIMDYKGNDTHRAASVDEMTRLFFRDGDDNRAIKANEPCVDLSAKLVTESYFKGLLNNKAEFNPRNSTNFKVFGFAVDQDMCEPEGVTLKYDITPCNKQCGCGTQTVSTTCIYESGPNAGLTVTEDAEEFSCCSPTTTVEVACNMHCCNAWHECDPKSDSTNTCANDNEFSLGTTLFPQECKHKCGLENVPKELRCMCKNTCVAEYEENVRIGSFKDDDGMASVQQSQQAALSTLLEAKPVADSYNHFNTDKCGPRANPTTCGWANCVGRNSDHVDYNDPDYKYIEQENCGKPCCVDVQVNQGDCEQPKCYMTNKAQPWFINVSNERLNGQGDKVWDCEQAGTIYQNGRRCVCDDTITADTPEEDRKTTCDVTADDGTVTKYVAGDAMSSDGPQCEYKRKDYINFNELVSGIPNKGDEDDFYCCTEEIEDQLYQQWMNWDDCDFVDRDTDKDECGCTDNPDERCGMQTRRRKLKCDSMRVDETTCPCVETRKCMMPVCPEQKDYNPSPEPCKFHYHSGVTPALSYKARQCAARTWKSMTDDDVHMTRDYRRFWELPDLFYSQNDEQYVGVHNSEKCSWCKCDQQIEKQDSNNQCGIFKESCCSPQGVHEWAAWDECKPNHDEATCGLGIRERTRLCFDAANNEIFGADEVDARCYIPNIRRMVPAAEMKNMRDDSEFYQKQECYAPCPDDLVKWSSWGPCTTGKGMGMRLRHGNELHKAKHAARHHKGQRDGSVKEDRHTQVDECDIRPLARPLAKGWSEWYETLPCSVKCGTGRIEWSRYNHDTGKGGKKEEKCEMAPCPTPPPPVCPSFSQWGEWTAWSSCNGNCGPDVVQSRSRCLVFPNGVTICDNDGTKCADKGRDKCSQVEERSCNRHADGTSREGELACPACTCTSTNDATLTAELRPCGDVNGQPCTACDANICGSREQWSEWGTCTQSCGGGKRYRERCFSWTSGENDGNRECAQDEEDCNVEVCPAVVYGDCVCDNASTVGNWVGKRCNVVNANDCEECDATEATCGATAADTLGVCSATCGDATQDVTTCFVWNNGNTDTCTTVRGACAGLAECPVFGSCTCDSTDKNTLAAKRCDQFGACEACDANVCGTQGDWGVWGTCSVTCGEGTQTRTRTFVWADDTLPVDDSEAQACTVEVNGKPRCPGFGEYKPFGPCNGNCRPIGSTVNPTQDRYRCWDDNTDKSESEQCGGGANGCTGQDCIDKCGNSICYEAESKDCNTEECAEVCSWTNWSEWTACNPTCASGIKTRSREGTPACTESSSEGSQCNNETPALAPCPACINKYSRCSDILPSFCNDLRYKSQLENMCAKHCGFCSKRR